MFKIIAQTKSGDKYTIYDPRAPDLKVISPVCKMTVNKAGMLTMTIPPEHPYIGKISKLSTVISLMQDDDLIFRGRILNDTFDLYNTRKVEVEGELAYLNDSVQPLAVYHDMPVAAYFKKMIEHHNTAVGEDRRFTPGIVTVTDSNDSLYRQSDHESTMDAIMDKLVDRLGGYLVVRYDGGVRYLDYLKEYGNVNAQRITPSTNLIDILHTIRGEDIATAIIPLGARLEDAEKVGTVKPRLTIAAANGGKDYIYDADAVAQWGWIYKTVVHDDITLVENLLRAGYKDLEAAKYLSGSIEADAVDLHLTDTQIERIKLGDMVLFSSTPNGIETQMIVSGVTIPVDAPGDTTYVLGTTYKTMTDQIPTRPPQDGQDGTPGTSVVSIIEEYVLSDSKTDAPSKGWVATPPTWVSGKYLWTRKKITYTNPDKTEYTTPVCDSSWEAIEETQQTFTEYTVEAGKRMDGISSSVTETQTQITTTTENIYDALGQLQETIVTDEALEEVKQLLISQWSDELELRFTSVLNLIDQTNGTVEENQRLLEQYIRFEGARIELGRSDSVIKAVLQNDRLSFVESGQEVAYISNRTLFIKDAQITQTLRFGNADSGYYIWAIGENSTYELTYSGP